jgi:hypothetical protein
MSIKFAEHGQINLSIEDGLLIIKATGPANIEMINSYRQQVSTFHQELKKTPWGSVAILQGEPFITPDASDNLVFGIKSGQELNLVASAVVIINDDYPSISKVFWQNIFEQTTLPFHFFDDIDEAKLWVQEQVKHLKHASQ